VQYKYDAWGNRIEKTVDTNGDGNVDSTARFAYDGWKTGPQQSFVGQENFDVWADLDGSNNVATRYLRGDVVPRLFGVSICRNPVFGIVGRAGGPCTPLPTMGRAPRGRPPRPQGSPV